MTSNLRFLLFLVCSSICVTSTLAVHINGGRLGENCDGEGNPCRFNLVCDGAMDEKTCKKIIWKGKDCTDATKFKCNENFVCSSNGGESPTKTCKRARSRGRKCGTTEDTCRPGLNCENGVCIRIVRVGNWCDGIERICEKGYSCMDDGDIKRCKFPAQGRSYTCLDQIVTFTSGMKADLKILAWTGVYEFTYDPMDRKISGKFGLFDTIPACAEGGPLDGDFNYHGSQVWTFNEETSAASLLFTTCDRPGQEFGPFDCTEVTEGPESPETESPARPPSGGITIGLSLGG